MVLMPLLSTFLINNKKNKRLNKRQEQLHNVSESNDGLIMVSPSNKILII